MENNWIVRPMLLANGLNLFIMEMKKRKSSKYFYSKKGDHHENLSSSQRYSSTTSTHSGSLSRKAQAIARWESGKGIPDIGNLIAISREFDLSLDQLIKEDGRLEKKVIEDSKAKKWHYLVIFYLFSVLVEIAIFAYLHHIFMAGFLVSTLFMLFYELRIFIKEKIWMQKED